MNASFYIHLSSNKYLSSYGTLALRDENPRSSPVVVVLARLSIAVSIGSRIRVGSIALSSCPISSIRIPISLGSALLSPSSSCAFCARGSGAI